MKKYGVKDSYEPSNALVEINNIDLEYPNQSLLEIENLDLEYSSKSGVVKALESINLNIYRNEFVCVLGPSGCGKSTLLKIIAGFLKPTGGKIELDGEEIKGIDWHRGVVFQQPNLYEWFDVKNNINFGLRMRNLPKAEIEEKTKRMLKKVGLEDFGNKKVYELSGGMKQRVGIARALINDPEILLMDEPFSALDALTKEQMQNFTRKLWWDTGKTIFFITHDVDEAMMLATRVIVLSPRPGTIIKEVPLHFTRDFVQDGNKKVKYTQEYYKIREELLDKIQNIS